MTRNRIITALAILIVLLPIFLFVQIETFSFLLLPIVAMAAWEWARLLKFSVKHALLYCLAVLLAIPMMWSNALLAPTLVLCAIFFWVIYVPYALYSGVHTIKSGERIFLMLMGIAVLCTCWLGFVGARQYGTSYLLSLLAVIWMSDIGAYFIGRAWGKHRLAAQISPGKTIEGALGGTLLSLIFVILLTLSNKLEPTFLGTAVARHGWISAVLLTILTISTGIIGDLFESLLKRQANMKDSGHFLPGHGGILDRIDALLPAIPLALLLNHLG